MQSQGARGAIRFVPVEEILSNALCHQLTERSPVSDDEETVKEKLCEYAESRDCRTVSFAVRVQLEFALSQHVNALNS